MPKISLITTCFNHPTHYLIDLIVALKAQTFKDFEWVVLADGCDPGPIARIMYDLLGKDAPFEYQLIRSERLGRSPALIKACSAARGDYLMLMDSDDWLDKHCLEELERGSQNYDLAFGSCFVHDARGVDVQSIGRTEIDEIGLILQYPDRYFHPCLFSRELYDKAGGFDPGIAACIDFDLWLRMFEIAGKAIKKPSAIYHYRRHINQMAVTHQKQQQEQSKIIRARYA